MSPVCVCGAKSPRSIIRFIRTLLAILFFANLLAHYSATAASADEFALPGLQAPVQVYLDGYAIPHIYAQSWTDASRVLGYLHAGERLWQMDMLRRQASGNLAEVVGPDGLPGDTLMRQLGIRRSCEEIWKSDAIPAALRAELEAYTAGVNQKIKELGKDNLPLAFQALDYQPQPWSPVDSLAFSKYMGWDQSGTMDDLWFGGIVEKMGQAAAEELWPLDRPYEQPTVTVQADRAKLAHADMAPMTGLADTYFAAFRRLDGIGWLGRGGSFGSNNWAVDGTKTKSGKPMVCSDPHLGFMLPSIWYTAHLSVSGQNVVGVTFPGAPIVVIGHNDHLAWGMTNMQADAVDYFVETVDPQNPQRYQHRGQWKEMTRLVEKIPVRGAEPHELAIDSTVHGPIVHREPKAISLCWTGLGPTTDSVAFWEISRAKNLQGYLDGVAKLEVPALNVIYGDVHGNVAIHPCGRLPLRARGQGRIPLDGASGDNDWSGWIPRDELPLAVNPPEHFVASANGRPHPQGYPHYLGWMWDPSYRTRRIKHLLHEAKDLTVETMKPIQHDHFDEAARQFLPAMLKGVQPLEGSAGGKEVAAALDALSKWDYVANRDAVGPAIWLRWLERYRDAVWDDEWASRGIEKQGGSWGFCGENRREPMLEILEHMTREAPESPWFDDVRTPERETRDTLLRRTLVDAVGSLQKQFGPDMSRWTWKHINVLKIGSLARDAQLDRAGGPVVGDAFTLNPGGNVGHVGGGASWRMIVDFAHPTESVGVYPGGQSENPFSEHYDDQIALWAKGSYTSLHMVGQPEKLPPAAKKASLTFKP